MASLSCTSPCDASLGFSSLGFLETPSIRASLGAGPGNTSLLSCQNRQLPWRQHTSHFNGSFYVVIVAGRAVLSVLVSRKLVATVHNVHIPPRRGKNRKGGREEKRNQHRKGEENRKGDEARRSHQERPGGATSRGGTERRPGGGSHQERPGGSRGQ